MKSIKKVFFSSLCAIILFNLHKYTYIQGHRYLKITIISERKSSENSSNKNAYDMFLSCLSLILKLGVFMKQKRSKSLFLNFHVYIVYSHVKFSSISAFSLVEVPVLPAQNLSRLLFDRRHQS